MSIEGTSWALNLRGITGEEFRVCWHLGDAYSKDLGCFLNLHAVCDACEMTPSNLTDILMDLQDEGIISVRWDTFPPTGEVRTRIFLLGLDMRVGVDGVVEALHIHDASAVHKIIRRLAT